MRHAETVTFGGSGLNRAAEERGHPGLIAEAGARVMLMWRGKPLLLGADTDQVATVAPDNGILRLSNDPPVFLGRDETGPIFVADINTWVPDDIDVTTLNSFLDRSLQHHPDLPADHVFAELRSVMTRLTPRDAELAATAKAVLGWHTTHRFCSNCGAESVMAQAGWQRNCPSCGRSHFPRTDPVVIMLITHNDSVLLGRSPGWPEGMYSLLAGFIEPGETMEAAVRREVFEEAGIQVGQVGYLASQPWPFPASLMFGCWGAAKDTEITLDPAELEGAIWLTRDELHAVHRGEHPTVNPARKGAIAHFLIENWLNETLD